MKKASPFGRGARVGVQVLMIVLVAASLLPLYNVVSASFKSTDEFTVNPFSLPRKVVLDNYQYAAFSGKLLRYTINSLIYVPIALALYVFVCVTAGYAFGKMRFALRRPLFLLVLFLSIFPQLLLATQVFKLVSLMRLTNSGFGAILSWVAYFAPFGTYIMTTYFSDMPYELVEAARLDGASPYRILLSVMGPLARPMAATLAIIGFQSMWNELPFSLLILQNQATEDADRRHSDDARRIRTARPHLERRPGDRDDCAACRVSPFSALYHPWRDSRILEGLKT